VRFKVGRLMQQSLEGENGAEFEVVRTASAAHDDADE
jgi:hypothetical protein